MSSICGSDSSKPGTNRLLIVAGASSQSEDTGLVVFRECIRPNAATDFGHGGLCDELRGGLVICRARVDNSSAFDGEVYDPELQLRWEVEVMKGLIFLRLDMR